MRATGNVITETLVSDSALKVVLFSTLYADVKEPAPGQSPGREVQTLKFLPAVKLKTVISASWRRPRFYGGETRIPMCPWVLVGVVGLTGLEPVTLRLSSACSNQLSYRP